MNIADLKQTIINLNYEYSKDDINIVNVISGYHSLVLAFKSYATAKGDTYIADMLHTIGETNPDDDRFIEVSGE